MPKKIPDTRSIKDLHLRIERALWEKIVKAADIEKRSAVMQAILYIERGMGLSK